MREIGHFPYNNTTHRHKNKFLLLYLEYVIEENKKRFFVNCDKLLTNVIIVFETNQGTNLKKSTCLLSCPCPNPFSTLLTL